MVSLLRQAAAETIGTGFLVAAVIGSGIAAARLSPGNLGLQLLENSVATGAALAAQVAGGAAGAVVANLMFGLPAITLAATPRTGAGLWLGEVVATVGLLLVIFGATRAGRGGQVGYLVGAYITAAYWFTSSNSFANPAVTLARTLSDTLAGIAPGSAPMFLLMQLLGGGLAYALIRVLYPAPTMIAATIADTAADAASPSPRSEVHR
ncbi:aquaporin family protein [Lapillicoccus sp.]|uniref:aquaporin family protein n=1 Tax=Lapillicoccus sp. TaxID=1909287 RepID=UPI0032673B8C